MSILEKARSHKPPMGIYEHSLFSHLSILFFHTSATTYKTQRPQRPLCHERLYAIVLYPDRLPFSPHITDDEQYCPYQPVDRHRYPDSKNTQLKMIRQNITEPNAEDPHRQDRDDHAISGIVGCPQRIAQCKGRRPDQDRADIMIDDDLRDQTSCLR